jgi:hypothetical protein
MNNSWIEAEAVGEADKEKRAFAWEVLRKSNDVVINFAKTMTTFCVAAVGAMLTLARHVGLDANAPRYQLVLLAVVCGLFLAAAVAFAYAVRGQRIDVSPDDYDDIVAQFLEAAARRSRATEIGFVLLILAATFGVIVIISSLATFTPAGPP